MRTYGHDGTIHGTKHLDVETDSQGNVVAVWFRCQLLPFNQIRTPVNRSIEMEKAYASGNIPELRAVVVKDKNEEDDED